MQPVDTALGKAPTPFADRVVVGPEGSRDYLIFQPLGSCQHDARPPRQSLRRPTPARKPLQFGALRSRQRDCNCRLPHRSYRPDRNQHDPKNLPIRTLVSNQSIRGGFGGSTMHLLLR